MPEPLRLGAFEPEGLRAGRSRCLCAQHYYAKRLGLSTLDWGCGCRSGLASCYMRRLPALSRATPHAHTVQLRLPPLELADSKWKWWRWLKVSCWRASRSLLIAPALFSLRVCHVWQLGSAALINFINYRVVGLRAPTRARLVLSSASRWVPPMFVSRVRRMASRADCRAHCLRIVWRWLETIPSLPAAVPSGLASRPGVLITDADYGQSHAESAGSAPENVRDLE